MEMTPAETKDPMRIHASRNTPPFISRVPTEILEDIFIQCACDHHYEPECEDGNIGLTVPCWVNVSYVCRHWRKVALRCPSLWTYLFIASERWTEELLVRSEQASLKLWVDFYYIENEPQLLDSLVKALDHLERIQELRLTLSASHTHQVIPKLSSRAPRLQVLEVTMTPGGKGSLEWPTSLFQGDIPSLRNLVLTQCPVPVHLFGLNNSLTTLHLCSVPFRFRPNMGAFLSTLSCLQNLRHLRLDGALANDSGFQANALAFETLQKINLPHLSRLLIAAPFSLVVAFFSCVGIPLKAHVCLDCHSERDPSCNYPALLCSLLAQRYSMAEDQTLSSPIIRTLAINFIGYLKAATLTCSTHEHDLAAYKLTVDREWDDTMPFQVKFMLLPEVDMVVGDICGSMALSNVRSLFVGEPPASPHFWSKLLGHLRGVRSIRLIDSDMPDLTVLSPTNPIAQEGIQDQDNLAVGGQGQSHMLAPQLEELELYRIMFASEGDPSPTGFAITRSRLYDALSGRRGSRGRLIITHCYSTGEYDNYIDQVVVWDEGSVQVVSEHTCPHEGGSW